MRLRRRSIRLRILLLIFVPLLSLIGLYAFVAGITIGDATKAARTPSLRNNAGEPVLQFLQQMEAERRFAALYSAAPTGEIAAQYRAQASKTNKFRVAMDAALNSSEASGNFSGNQKVAVAALVRDSSGLATIRSDVLARNLSPLDVVHSYGAVSADIHLFMTRLAQRVSPEVQLQAYSLFQSIASLEMLAQEDAIIEAGAASGSLPNADRAEFVKDVALRRQYAVDAGRNITKHLLPTYTRDVSPQAEAALASLEDTITGADPQEQRTFPVDPATWGQSVGAVGKGTGAAVQLVAVDVSGQGASVAHSAYLRLGLAGGLGLLALVASLFISFRVRRGLVRRLAALRDSALTLASVQLPRVMTRLRAGEDVDVAAEASPMKVTPDEIGQVGQAFNTVQLTAVEAAVVQARLRRGISDVFRNLARRSQSLLHRQLTLLDAMERRTSDPDEMADLYRLDHLTTRMRRHAEGLIILSGAQVGRSWRSPVPLADVMRAAVAEVEDYTRVSVHTMTQAALAGPAVADVIHMIAELVENATLFSPPHTPVRVTGDIVGQGFAVDIEDRGLGMDERKLAEINDRLANPPEFDLSDSDQLGLFVAGRLAQRNGVRISMQPNAYGGSTAIVLIPSILVVSGDLDTWHALPAGEKGTPQGGRHVDGGVLVSASNGQAALASPAAPGSNGTDPGAAPDAPQPAAADPLVGAEAVPDSSHQPDASTINSRPWMPPNRPPPAAPPPAASPAAPPPVAGMGHGDIGLPRRVRQASLAPQLRVTPPPGPQAEPEPSGYRSPDQTRAMMSSLQRGWERGRSAPGFGLESDRGQTQSGYGDNDDGGR